jgi:hypothetical protein
MSASTGKFDLPLTVDDADVAVVSVAGTAATLIDVC